jgi:RNA polymerase sigma factor (sigma-70 family)
METYNRQTEVDGDPATDSLIRHKARSLEARYGPAYIDRQDLEQDLRLALLRAQPKLDPSRGAPGAFARSVIERQAASLARHHAAQKRNGRGVLSLNVDVPVQDEGRVELAATISDREQQRRLGTRKLGDFEHSELAHDLDVVLQRIPHEDRELIRALKWRTVADIARATGAPRTTIQSRIQKYRELFEDASLREYLR